MEAGALGGATVHEILEVLAIHLHQSMDISCRGRHAVPGSFSVSCSVKLRAGQSGRAAMECLLQRTFFPRMERKSHIG